MTPDPRLDRLKPAIEAGLAAIHGGEAATLAGLLLQFDRLQWLEREQIEAMQCMRLARLAAHFAACDPEFARRLEEAGIGADVLASPGELKRLPPLDRSTLQSHGLDRVEIERRLPPGQGKPSLFSTSGSTGEPVRVWRANAGRVLWSAMTLRNHLWAEQDFTGRLAGVRANQTQFGTRDSWGPLVESLFDSGASLLIDIETDINAQLEALADFAPDSVMIYPSNLSALLDAMEERGVKLPSVRRWRTLGETLAPSLAERARSATGAGTFDCYSSEEIGYVALQCPDVPGRYHAMDETVLLEIVHDDGAPCNPGEIGQVMVTDLTNHAMPIIRYAIGDHAEAAGPCPCGRGLLSFARIWGRSRNMIVKPDGSRHWPLTGFKGFRDIAPIRQYQFVQHSTESIKVRLRVERALTAQEEEALRRHICAALRHPFTLDFVYFDAAIPSGPNGKFEEFVSLIA